MGVLSKIWNILLAKSLNVSWDPCMIGPVLGAFARLIL